ncbi:MAG: glycoside hydrolase family 65 protein [Acidimicrobiales bacterium]
MIDHPAYEVAPWRVRESGFRPEILAQSESVFALANGYLGLRGNLDEGEPAGAAGTYLNGFHDVWNLEYPERGYGWADVGQRMLNVTDGKIFRLFVDGERLDVRTGELVCHERVLDLRGGTLTRLVDWRSPSGKRVRIVTRRVVPLFSPHVAAISYEVEPVDGPAALQLVSELARNEPERAREGDPRAGSSLRGQALSPVLSRSAGHRAVMAHATRRSGLTMAAGMDHHVTGADEVTSSATDDVGQVAWAAHLQPGQSLAVTKVLAYHWSADRGPEALCDQVGASLDDALRSGFGSLCSVQRAYLDAFWAAADVEVDGDSEVQQGLRFALFHVLQASACASGNGIPAKGLTGQGYDGHSFWDTETFVLPLLTYTMPALVRNALTWRASGLGKARAEAARRGLAGAKFPWRTINGAEASAYFAAGAAAVHVNADVAVAVERYVQAAGDEAFLAGAGADILVETARMWVSRGYHSERRGGAFCIDGVTGPDEYSALVDNNVYTNLMAARNLRGAADCVDALAASDPPAHGALSRRLGLQPGEAPAWRRAAREMFVPWDPVLGVHPQDEDFCRHERWDFEGTPRASYPLMLHYPYADLYSHQVVKQADLVLALHLAGGSFDAEQKRADFDYYEGLTVRDSSLSACTQAVVAAEVGHLELTYAYLREAALMDVEDLERNTADGIHIASLAGAWVAVVAGVAGMRDGGPALSFCPRLPAPLTRVSFPLQYRGRRLRLTLAGDDAVYSLEAGDPITVSHWGRPFLLERGVARRLPVPAAPLLARPSQVPGRAPGRRSG